MTAVWDEERERFYVNDSVGLAMFENTGTDWQYTSWPDFRINGVFDQLQLSANGELLVVWGAGGLILYDAETIAELSIRALDDSRPYTQAAIDKFDEIFVSSQDNRNSKYKVFTVGSIFLREAEADIQGPPGTNSRTVSVASGNGDVVMTANLIDDGWTRVDTTDMSEQFFATSLTNGVAPDGWVSFSGEYAEINEGDNGSDRIVLDANMGFVGRIPATTNFDDQVEAIRTPGLWIDEAAGTAMASFSEPTQQGQAATRVRYELYDLTSATDDPFVPIDSHEEVGTFNPGVYDKDENYFIVSDDGATVFRIGDRIQITPNPF